MREILPLRTRLAADLILGSPFSHAADNLMFCSKGSPTNFDPVQYTIGTDCDATSVTLLNRFVQLECGGTRVILALAKSWGIGGDGRIYTFHLRKSVKLYSTGYFKSTRGFNADDVLFTSQRMLNKNHPLRKIYLTEFPYFTDIGLDKNIVGVEKLNKHRVKLTLSGVDAVFIQSLAMDVTSIQSAEYAGQLLKTGKLQQINQKPIGIGPFILSRCQKDAQIRFRGNKDYQKSEDVEIDNLIFSISIDAAVRAQGLKAGKCQIILNPRPVDLKALQEVASLRVSSQPSFNLGYIAYSVIHRPFDQLEVRRALDMAVNKRAIVDAVYQGVGQLTVNSMPPTQWSYGETIKDAPFDPTKIRELLRKAGVAEDTEITLWAMPVQRPYDPNTRLMMRMIQVDWAKTGIEAGIVNYEWDEYIKRACADEHDAMLFGWAGDSGDPGNWLVALYGCDPINGNNVLEWCDAACDKLVKITERVSDRDKHSELYRQAQHILKEQVPVTPIIHSTVYQPMNRSAHDFKISPFSRNAFYGVTNQP